MRGPFTRPFQGHSHFCWSACLKLLDFNSALFVNLSWANSLVLSSVNSVFDLLNTDWKKSFCKEPLLNKNVTVSFLPFYLPMFTNTGAVLWIWLVILHAAAVQRLWGNALIYYWPWRWVCCLEAQMLIENDLNEKTSWESSPGLPSLTVLSVFVIVGRCDSTSSRWFSPSRLLFHVPCLSSSSLRFWVL